MKKSSLLFLLLSLTTFIFAQQRPSSRPVKVARPAAQPFPSGRVIGSVFSDFFYIVNEPSVTNVTQGTDGRNEFTIRRAHIGYEHLFNRDFTGRIVLDAADGTSNLVREANIKWDNLFPMHFITIGMMQTPAERTTERIWGYRSLDEMVLNRLGFAQEFDMGVEFGGKFNPQGSAYYSLAATNGTGIVAETDKVKKYSVLFGFLPDRRSALEIYADYENLSFGGNVITGKIFYGITGPAFAFGVEGFYRMYRWDPFPDITPAGGSIFTWFEMTQGLRGVLRVDGIDSDLNESNLGAREVYVNAGLDITPIPEVHIIPNVGYIKYFEKSSSFGVPADFIIARLTAAVYFPTFN